MVNSSFQQNLLCAAICAAPSIFGKAGILNNLKATCFPGYEDQLGKAIFVKERVVRDRNVITSRGAGTAVEFGLAIVDYLAGKAEADKVSGAIQFTDAFLMRRYPPLKPRNFLPRRLVLFGF